MHKSLSFTFVMIIALFYHSPQRSMCYKTIGSMKNILSLFVCIILTTSICAQAGGIRVYAGSTAMVNKDVIASPTGFSHSGFHIGVDGRLMSGRMAFLVGGRFTSTSKVAVKDFKLKGHSSKLTVMNGRGGLDISIFSISHLIRIRTKVLASLDIVLGQSGPDLPPPGYNINDGWAGIVTGLGADIGPAIVDIEYEFGVINGYNKRKDSTFSSLSFSLGFFF